MQISNLSILLSTKCNFNCSYCSYGGLDYTLSYEDVIYAIEKLGNYGLKSVVLTGGEPFLHKAILPICDHINEKGLTLSICTNGSVISEKILKHFQSYDIPVCFNLSLDSHDKDINDSQRNRGSYFHTIRSVKLLKKHGFSWINVGAIITNKTKGHIEKTADFILNELQATQVGFGRPARLGNILKNEDLIIDNVKDYIQEINNLSIKHGQKVFYFHTFCSTSPLTCPVLNNSSLLLFADGNFIPCCDMLDSSVKYGSLDEPMKNIFARKKSIDQKINSKCFSSHNSTIKKKGTFDCYECIELFRKPYNLKSIAYKIGQELFM